MTQPQKYQKSIPWWRTSFGQSEVDKLAESVSNEHISQGPVTAEFEEKFASAINMPFAVATTSGSVALLISLMALGIERGDEVIVPNRTWIATAHAVLMLGAKVVLVDVKPDSPIIDIDQVRKKITPKTKAILPVHVNGRACDIDELNLIAEQNNLHIIEDAAQAMFSKNKEHFLGTQSSLGCFSFSPAKLVSTGQGGMIVTKNRAIYESLKLILNHGVIDNFTDRWTRLGFNFKFTDLLASFGIVQLDRTKKRIAHLYAVYDRYKAALDNANFPFIRMIPNKIKNGELPLYIEALSTERQRLMNFLTSHEIETRPATPNLHTSDYLNNPYNFPNSNIFSEQGLILPCGPEQPLDNVEKVIECLYKYSKQFS